jgi:hypothetical protein
MSNLMLKFLNNDILQRRDNKKIASSYQEMSDRQAEIMGIILLRL